MPTISVARIEPQSKLFHNKKINVYPMALPLDKIHFWKDNNRTIFTFERLLREKKKKPLQDLSIEDITQFVAEQDIHKIPLLASSIERNGVQVPLIISDDGRLLDGNRRFFACQYLKMQYDKRKEPLPPSLSTIPVMIIRKIDLNVDDTLELKIIAEANFIPDLKIAWPLDAQARAVEKYFKKIQKAKKTDYETTLGEVISVFGIPRQRATDLLDTLELTKQFIVGGVNKNARIKRREIVEDKFVYLWEFRNKAMKGSRALKTSELGKVKTLFFQFMAKGQDNPIKSLKQIEPLIQSVRVPAAWSMLKQSKGAKLAVVVSMINEKKEGRKSEDRLRVFLGWLKDADDLTPNAKALMREVAKLATQKSRD